MMPDPGGSARGDEDSARGDEDAERVTVGVGIDEELFGRVVRTVEEEAGPQSERSFVLGP